jgi:hypothetical protein
MGLFCLRELHDLWAAASGLLGSVGIRWSAVNGSCVPLFAFSTDPAVGCCVSHDLCSALVCACIVWALGLGVRLFHLVVQGSQRVPLVVRVRQVRQGWLIGIRCEVVCFACGF